MYLDREALNIGSLASWRRYAFGLCAVAVTHHQVMLLWQVDVDWSRFLQGLTQYFGCPLQEDHPAIRLLRSMIGTWIAVVAGHGART